MDTPFPADSPAPFVVISGPDYAGKSSVMSELARKRPPARLISVDPQFLAPRHAVVADLRRAVLDMAPGLGSGYSPDLLLSVMQTAVVHLRDLVLAGSTPAVVDSYYYKILAKCRLIGIDEHPLFSWWRAFPRPHRVFWLDVSPQTAWRRSNGRANRLEHHGERLDRDSFESFQSALGKLMLDELDTLPVTFLPENADVALTAQAIREAIDDER